MPFPLETFRTPHTPETLVEALAGVPGRVLLRSQTPAGRHSLVAARPFLVFRSQGARCETRGAGSAPEVQFGNPWQLLESLLERFEIPEPSGIPFPVGGAFGFWGYELNQFLEPRLPRRAVNDLEFPDCHLGFHSSVVVFDHRDECVHVVSSGFAADGTRSVPRAREETAAWRRLLESTPGSPKLISPPIAGGSRARTTLERPFFLAAVRRAQAYIHTGDIYQVNLAQRLDAPHAGSGWDLFRRLAVASPAPHAAWIDAGDFELVSSSPESFLEFDGAAVRTRPIKGTRPRSADPVEDARLRDELLASEKERAELVMITDLLRNDLGRVCEFGSVRVPELMRLEPFSHVQHLVSTIEGILRPGLTHLEALAACFPGGSITGAPKLRAMEIIDELEPVARGPYCGTHGYLGFNRQSRLAITIRTAIVRENRAWFHVGAGIVADSVPESEYDETIAKAGGILAALGADPPRVR